MTFNEIVCTLAGMVLGAMFTTLFYKGGARRAPPAPKIKTAADEFWFQANCQRCQAQNEYQLRDLNMMNCALCGACQTRNVYHSVLAKRIE